MADPFHAYEQLLSALVHAGVRFLVIGVSGANFYARRRDTLFVTQDMDLFFPTDPRNLLAAWEVCTSAGFELFAGGEPLGRPIDDWLARRVVQSRAAVRALNAANAKVDLSLTMAGCEFEDLWREKLTFHAGKAEVPVAPLHRIVESKRLAGRPKDHLFFVSHEEVLSDLLEPDEDGE